MNLIYDKPIPVKIQKMKERVRWLHSSIVQRGIDQTSMVLDDGKDGGAEFSFMVIGDSGTTCQYGHHPQREIAQLMLRHRDECSFVLHTGDVIYTVGSREYYRTNFIAPYREFIRGGENPQNIAYDRMVFDTPILPVLGNHDYYDVPLLYRLLTGPTLNLRRRFRYKDFEIGWHGSYQGDTYARAFLDYLKGLTPQKLELHLDEHYTAKTDAGRCLRYQPGHFTRLPNRYYTFRYGGIDFFALDSNTFNQPSPIPATKEGEAHRRQLQKRGREIDREINQILEAARKLNRDNPQEAQQHDALEAKLNQIDEAKIDIEKQLAVHGEPTVDYEQLHWLQERLIASWNTAEVRGRIVYFHHPPYVTEANKSHQAQTLAVRRNLRACFDKVAATLGSLVEGRGIVDLILNGHAHCLEYLRTTDTGHGDSHLNCIISGGSGHYLRRQQREGAQIKETFVNSSGTDHRKVADSLLFIGRNGDADTQRFPYSFVRIDVKAGNPPKFVINPIVAERYYVALFSPRRSANERSHGKWSYPQMESFALGG